MVLELFSLKFPLDKPPVVKRKQNSFYYLKKKKNQFGKEKKF